MSEPIVLDGGWRLWRQFSLRGPGFPAEGVLRLAPDGLAVAADKFAADDPMRGPDWDAFVELFGDAAVRTATALQDIAASPAFRAALAWQNPAVLRSGIEPFLAWTPSATGRTSMPRQREELVAHYWQRFCVKNDTIGFFGPVGWGRLDPSTPGVRVDPGTGLTARSEVYFSSWAIDELAKTIGADPRIRPWIPPRRVSFVRVTDDAVLVPRRAPQPISPLTGAILLRCDGTRPVGQIAAELTASRGEPVTAAEVTAEVEAMVERRWVVWRIEVPTAAYPERELRAILDRVGDESAQAAALATLDALEERRDRVRAAGRDPEALVAAIADLEAEFSALTTASVQREKGARTAPCRGLVYSDSRRSATATVGAGVLDQLTPLAMCLTAARWMTNRIADAVRAHVRAAYDRLLAERGVVDLGALWLDCLPAPHPAAQAEIERVTQELRARWERIVAAPPGARRVRLRSADIAPAVREAFDEPGDGWGLARYISPDVIVLASDPDAVERGDVDIVVGELHVAMNTIGASLFVMQHPDIESLLAETTLDFPGPRVMPMLYKEKPPRWSARSRPALTRPEDYVVGLVDYTADPHRPRTVLSADVLVELRDDRLTAVLPDGAEFDLLDVFGHALTERVMDRFTLRPDGDHSPRITVDRVVLARETWKFTAADLAFAAEKDEARRFVRARRWRDDAELPRFVFVTSPAEPRPLFVDFDSPVYVNILAKAARRLAGRDPAGRLTVSEMLPDPEQAWLTDDGGRRYTSEFRFVAVDESGRPGATTSAESERTHDDNDRRHRADHC